MDHFDLIYGSSDYVEPEKPQKTSLKPQIALETFTSKKDTAEPGQF